MTGRNTLAGFMLLTGGASIVAACAYTLAHLEDHVVFSVLVPGVVVGLLLIGGYVRARGRS
jgi:hypothetical protein